MEETLEDILSINPDEPMPIVREGDDEWPSEEEISAQLEVSKEAGRRMGMEVRRTYVDKKNVTPDREKENLRDLDMKKKPQKEGEKVERKDKPSPSNSIKGSDTKHKVEVS